MKWLSVNDAAKELGLGRHQREGTMSDPEIRVLPKNDRSTRCKHHTGMTNERCAAGVRYLDVALDHEPIRYRQHPGSGPYSIGRSFPCLGKYNLGGATCPKLELPTAQEVESEEAASKRSMDLLRRGLSSCCEAAIDESRVIRDGRHKGHGPRFCSKCGKCLFIV